MDYILEVLCEKLIWHEHHLKCHCK